MSEKFAEFASKELVAMTILVLVWLELKCPGLKDSWQLIHAKAAQWLKENNVVFQDFYDLARVTLN